MMPLRNSIAVPALASLLIALLGGCAMQAPASQAQPSTKHSPPSATHSPPSVTAASTLPDDLGSTRNSRVAFPMPAGQRVPLVFLSGEMAEDELKDLQAVAPNVRIIAGLNRQSAMAHAAEEFVPVEEIGLATRVLTRVVREWCEGT